MLFSRCCWQLANRIGKDSIVNDAAWTYRYLCPDSSCLHHDLIQHRIGNNDTVKAGPAGQHRHCPLGLAPGSHVHILPFGDIEKGHGRNGDIAATKLQLCRQHRGHLVLGGHPPDP